MFAARFRPLAVLGLFTLAVAPASAQMTSPPAFIPTLPADGQYYFNSGVPIYGWTPGLNFAPGNVTNFVGPRGIATPFYYGYFGSPYGLPYSPNGMFAYDAPLYGGYYSPYYMAFTTPLPSNDFIPPPEQPAGIGPVINIKLQGMSAWLNLQFPAVADVWVNGKRLEGTAAASRELTSPVLKPGTDYTWDIKAEWAKGGKSYEYTRTIKVPSGERSKVTVINGTPKTENKDR